MSFTESSILTTAYSAMAISISGRFIFMYLLYTKKSTNTYSLLFSVMNIASSALWITYSQMVEDMPLMVRGSADLLMFSMSTAYILSNRRELAQNSPAEHLNDDPGEVRACLPH